MTQPQDPDARPQPVAEAVNAANAWICRVWQLALAEGVRNGMDIAATLCDVTAKQTRARTDRTDDDVVTVATAEFLRDKIREFSLTVEDPPPVPWGGGQ